MEGTTLQLILPHGAVNEPGLRDFSKASGLATWGLDYQVRRRIFFQLSYECFFSLWSVFCLLAALA